MNAGKITLYKGITGSGKTTLLMNQYQRWMDQGIASHQILVLLRNRRQSQLWKESIQPSYSAKLKLFSYFGFVQEELRKYWPLVQWEIPWQEYQRLEPVFMTIETSQSIMEHIVDEHRRRGKLLDVGAAQDRIAMELIHNLSKAAMGIVALDQIGEILYGTQGEQGKLSSLVYREIQEICDQYMEETLEKGVLDYGMTIYLYDRYLRNNKDYIALLRKQNPFMIVDDLEEAVPTEAALILDLLEEAKGSALTYNTDGEMTRALGACPELIEETIFPLCTQVELKECYTRGKHFKGMGGQIKNSIVFDKQPTETAIGYIELLEAELRSEMLNRLGEKVLTLLQDGVKPREIAVICPVADSVTAYTLRRQLEKGGYGLESIARNKRAIDQVYVKALVTMASIAHPQWDCYTNPEDLAVTISVILDIDPIRCHLLTKEIMKQRPYQLPPEQHIDEVVKRRIGQGPLKKYESLRRWLNDYMTGGIYDIEYFFQKFFGEVLIFLPHGEKQGIVCKQLIDSAGNFRMVMASLGNEGIDINRRFIDAIKKGMKAGESQEEIHHKRYCEDVILVTPYTYLSFGYQRKVQIWSDVLSEEWASSDVKALTNPYVFSPKWNPSQPWNDDTGAYFRKRKLGITVNRLINRCGERIIAAQSLYSKHGYEQEGLLGIALQGTCSKK
ncbi:UvrD-helicase domain-containing protein [Anaerosolibacter sp.]|uniref:UvrD-helicase domain-containing protein n=1 Tax=Anaerosolibacter sp. TaxID=1872527 RepID=UPI0039EFF505